MLFATNLKDNYRDKKSFITDVFFVLLVFSPVLSNYSMYGKFSLGDACALLFFLYYLTSIKVNILDAALIFSAVFLSVISFYKLNQEDFNLGFYRASFFYILFFFMLPNLYLNYKRFLTIYSFLSFFFAASILVQWLLYSIFNVSISLQLPLSYYEPDTLNIIDHVYRSGGFFKEPSYFVLFVTPLLFYLLRANIFGLYVFLIIAGVVSTSSLIFFVFLASVGYLLLSNIRFLYLLIFLLLVFLLFFALYVFHDFFISFIFYERILSIFLDGGTLNDRFLNSFLILDYASGLFSNKEGYLYFINGGDGSGMWFSSFGALLASFGFLGVFLIILKLFLLDKFFGLILFFLMLTTHIYSGVYIFFITFAFICVSNYFKLMQTVR